MSHALKVWIFRGLAAIAVAIMVISFYLPWWTADLTVQGYAVQEKVVRVYGWGLRHDLEQLRNFLLTDETPPYQTVIAWAYLAASALAVLASALFKGKWSRWIPGLVGLVFILYAVAALVIVRQRTGDFDVALQGWTTIRTQARDARINASLGAGYYLACVSGALLIALSVLRNIFIRAKGRSELPATETTK